MEKLRDIQGTQDALESKSNVFIIWAELKHWTAVRQENQSINRQEAKSDKYKQKQEEYQDHCANHLFVCTVKIKKIKKKSKVLGVCVPE